MITALAQWFGGDRMLGAHIGRLLGDCKWAGIPFAGGMSALLHIKARTMLVNDLHRHVINLARVVADDGLRAELVRRLETKAFHLDELKDAQHYCSEVACPSETKPDLVAATSYFVASWMGRSGLGGTKEEFHGRTATRWNAGGGDSNVRYRNAVAGLEAFSVTLKRCTFETMDALEFLARCEDKTGHGLYCDPPFPGPGRDYKHNAGQTDAGERDWHARLADAVTRFGRTKVLMRFYDHDLIRSLYPESRWQWNLLEGRTQANAKAPEVLLANRADGERLF